MFLENKNNLKKFRPKQYDWSWLKLSFISLFLICLIIILFVAAPLFFYGWQMYGKANNIKKSFSNIELMVKKNDWQGAADEVVVTKNNLQFIDSNLKNLGPIMYYPKAADMINGLGMTAAAIEDLLDAGHSGAKIMAEISKALNDKNLSNDLSQSAVKKIYLEKINQNKLQINEIIKNIDGASAKLKQVDSEQFIFLGRRDMADLHHKLSLQIEEINSIISLLPQLPELAGYDQEKKYLLIFQNNTEMRPSGGFIGSYGIIKIKDGEITDIFTDDIYNLDKHSEGKLTVEPPKPFLEYSHVEEWYMRDANWSPDWAESVKQIIWFFNQEMANAGQPAMKFDGVIAFTPDLISKLLGVVGPVMVQDINFDDKNFTRELQMLVEFGYEANGIERSQRKSPIGEISKIIIDKMEQMPVSEWQNVWQVMKNNLDNKQVSLFFYNNELQKIFSRNNWTGEVKKTEGDYLMVIDSNMMALKTDQVLTKKIKYNLNDEDDKLAAVLTLSYDHSGEKIEGIIGQYKDYVRIYLPANTTLKAVTIVGKKGEKELNLSEDVDFLSEFDKKVYGFFFTVDPGEKKEIVMRYNLPMELFKKYTKGDYSLLVQKQAGTSGHKLEIDLDFKKKFSEYQSEQQPIENLSWSTDLSRDRQFVVKF